MALKRKKVEHSEFLKLFMPAQPTLRSYVFSLVRDMNETEDIVQEVSMVLWKEFEKFDSSRSFTAWSLGIARNYVLRWRRKKARSKLVFVEELEQELAKEFAGLELELQERRTALQKCVKSLGDQSRSLLRMRYEESLSLNQMADAIGKTLNAVNKALGKIRGLLLKCAEKAIQSS